MKALKNYEIKTTVSLTASKDGARTFSYTKRVDGRDGIHGIFILLYPTRTSENYHVDDLTNRHLTEHLTELGLSSYTVINLFSTVTQSRLSTRGLQIDSENLDYIRENFLSSINSDTTRFYIAWGSSLLSSRAVNLSKQAVLDMWEELHPDLPLYQITSKSLDRENIGAHPLYMGIRCCNEVWETEPFPLDRARKELTKRLTIRRETAHGKKAVHADTVERTQKNTKRASTARSSK